MNINGEYFDYQIGIKALENKFGEEIESSDYFTFYENCEDFVPEFKTAQTRNEAIDVLLNIYAKLGNTPEERSNNIWHMFDVDKTGIWKHTLKAQYK